MSEPGGGGGDSSSTERSSHTSSTALLTEAVRPNIRSRTTSQESQGSSWRTTPILEALTRPAQLGSPSLAARRLTRWKRIASDDMEKCMMEECEDGASSKTDGGREATLDDDDGATDGTPGDSTDSAKGGPAKSQGSGVPPLSECGGNAAHVLLPLSETNR